AAAAPRGEPAVAGLDALDLEGRVHRLGGRAGTAPFALVFLGVDCPISRKSIPKLNELAKNGAPGDAGGPAVQPHGALADPPPRRSRARRLSISEGGPPSRRRSCSTRRASSRRRSAPPTCPRRSSSSTEFSPTAARSTTPSPTSGRSGRR